MSSTAPAEATGLRSVSISTQVLDCFSDHEELGPSQVARELGVAKSTAFQMLSALAHGGLLERTERGRYRLSLRLFDYGQLVLDRLPVRRLARPVLEELHADVAEMVQLGLPAHRQVVYVERLGHGALRPSLSGEWMRKVPGHASSAGRVLAAYDSVLARAMFAAPLTRYTRHTVVDPAQVRGLLAGIRARGWVRTVEEAAVGYTSTAAPVFDADGRAVAAVSVVGATPRMTGHRGDFLARRLRTAAARVTDELRRA